MRTLPACAILAGQPLGACASTAPVTDGNAPAAIASCFADAAQSAVGKIATADVVEQARKDAGADMARVLKPGQVVTTEYREGRLNVAVDADYLITSARYG